MAKSVCGRSEGVENGRVDLAVVVVVESLGEREDVQLSHEVSPQDDGQPLVVMNMLIHQVRSGQVRTGQD